LVHVGLIWPHYFVGSFGDDAGYILTGKALLAGEGLTGHVGGGTLVASVYLPGYSALLVPLLWLWPHTFDPLRLLSVACYGALFPLTWVYLGRRRLGDATRVAALAVLALGPVLATFGSMVMAETPFLVLFLVLLLLVDRWDTEERALTGNGVAVVLAAAGLVWLKEAGIGVVAGLALWLLLRRAPAFKVKVAALVGGVAALLAPVLVARLAAGVPVAGSLYTEQLGGYYHGGLLGRLIHVVPHSLWQMLSTALPATLVPYGSPLPYFGHDPDIWKVLSWQVTVLTIVGAVVWARRHRDATVAMVPVYLAMTLLWPAVNERRVILVLPVVAAWYVVGAKAVWDTVWDRVVRRDSHHPTGRLAGLTATAVVVVAGLVVVPLSLQLPRDYLFARGVDSSHFQGSRYVQILSQLGPSSQVVETDYPTSTALFTGHRTAGAAFLDTVTTCDASTARADLAAADAGYLLLGYLNKPFLFDSPCLLSLATSNSWAVRLLQTSRDGASVFELIGPGTGHPDLRDLVAAGTETTATAGAARVTEWDWGGSEPVTQVSVGEAGSPGSTTSVLVQLQGANGVWRTVTGADSAVGDGAGVAPYLLASLPSGTQATALRVVISGSGGASGPGAAAGSPGPADVHALGPIPGATS